MVFGRLSFNMHCMCLRCLGGMGGSHLTCTVGSWCLDGWAGFGRDGCQSFNCTVCVHGVWAGIWAGVI